MTGTQLSLFDDIEVPPRAAPKPDETNAHVAAVRDVAAEENNRLPTGRFDHPERPPFVWDVCPELDAAIPF